MKHHIINNVLAHNVLAHNVLAHYVLAYYVLAHNVLAHNVLAHYVLAHYTLNRLGHKIFYVRGGYFLGEKLRFSCDIFVFGMFSTFLSTHFIPRCSRDKISAQKSLEHSKN